MNAKQQFEKHYARFNLEAILLSTLSGLVIGLACGFIASTVTWITAFNGLWLTPAIVLAVTVVSAAIFYFAKYRPTVRNSAKRLDSLGLKERVITMVEFKDDNSTMAELQRADAKRHLETIAPSQIKITVSKALVVLLSVFGFLSVGMTVVSALGAAGILPNGNDFLEDVVENATPEVYISVTYEVEEGGYIEGVADQLVLYGADADPVTAVAEEGYIFVEWDDGSSRPGRSDKKITEEVIYVAIFEPIADEGDGSDESDNDTPKDPNESEDASQSRPGEDPSDSSGGAGGKYEEANQIINGETYYREVLESYKELLQERLETEGDKLTEEERQIIESYLGIV